MTASSAMLRGRAAAEALMIDACTITRGTGARAPFNPVDGTYTVPDAAAVYAGACKVQQRGAASTDLAGGDVLNVTQTEVHLPMSATGVQVGDLVTITSAAHDAALVGRTYRVTNDPAKTYATARRLQCEEVL